MSYDVPILDGGKYLKITDEVVHIHLLSKKPKAEMIHGFGKQTLTCAGEGCNQCKTGDAPRQQFSINVWDRKAKRIKIYKFGVSVAGQIREFHRMLKETDQTVHEVDFKIKMREEGGFKKYTVMQVPKAGPVPVDYIEGFDPMLNQADAKEEAPPTDEEPPF